MKIVLAQLKSFAGQIEANIEIHKKWIECSIRERVSLIVFPELSLTGYEPKLAKDLATLLDDIRFSEFQEISDSNDIAIAFGMPIKDDSGILIGMPIFEPGKPRKLYAKQLLHSDEHPYFTNGQKEVFLKIHSFKIAPAICYESLQLAHAEKASQTRSQIYMASVAKSVRGIEKANQHMPEIARKHSMIVLMSNCVGPCDDFVGAGGSAVWDQNGALLGQLNDTEEAMLIFDTETKNVSTKIYKE